jgi:autotransporter-associated beta strand protein
VAATLLTAALAATAHAATNTWAGSAGSADWATAANWSVGSITSGDALVFTSANASASNTLTNTLATSFTAAGITFNSGALGYTMTGNAFNLSAALANNASGVTEAFNNDVVLTNTGATSTWTLASGTTTTFNGGLTSSANIRTVWWGASATASSGTINLNGAANLTFGGSNFSALILRGNGTVLNVGSTGSLTVSSASQSSSGFFNIGNEGSAGNVTVNIASGGSITVNGTGNATKPTSSIGGKAGDIADVNIDGTMSYGSGTNLAIGSTSGTTTVDINNGGILNLNDSSRSVAVAASGTITINSGGTLTSARTWGASTGNLVLAGGTFQATAAQTLDSGLHVSTTDAGSTIDTNGNAVSIGNAISGSGGLIKAGANTLTLSGANAYTGATTINAGTLKVSGSIGASSGVTINGSGATLAGTGTVSGITLTSGTITPGDGGIGTLAASALDWAGGNTLTFDLGAVDSSADLLSLSGAFTKSGSGTYAFDFSGGLAGQTYTLINFGSNSGFSVGDFSVNSGISGTFGLSGTSLTFTAVPEPHEFALAIVGLLGVMVFIRRRQLE